MHDLRRAGTGPETSTPVVAKRDGKTRRQAEGASLAAIPIRREEARKSDQRREDRHVRVVEEATFIFRRRRHAVAVLNVSRHGAMIGSPIVPRIGERAEIRFEDCNRTECSVRWVRDGRIGLEFAHETVIVASAAKGAAPISGRRDGEVPNPPPRPTRDHRERLLWQGELHWSRGTVPVRLRNVSAQGAMITAGENLPKGAEVVLTLLGAGAVSATVRWCRSGQIGIRFDKRFDVKKLLEPTARPEKATPGILKPLYLQTELDADSPWAARRDKLRPEDLS